MFGKILGYKLEKNTLIINFENKKGIVNFIDDGIVQFKEEKTSDFAFNPMDLISPLNIEVSLSDGVLKANTGRYTYFIKDDFLVDIEKEGKLISSSKNEITSKREILNKELQEKEGHEVNGDEEYLFSIQKVISNDDYIYGLGDKSGFLNKIGYEYEMYNTDNPAPQVECFKALYKSIPFYIVFNSSYQYGFFFDNTYKQHYDVAKTNPNIVKTSIKKGYYNYYFIGGDSLKEVVENYTFITGRMELPQIWTLGNQQSRWSYMSKEELLDVAHKFREYDIPCDTLYLDIDYMDNYKVFTTNDKTFPEFKKMVDELSSMNFKLVTIIDPGVKKEDGYEVYEELIKNDLVATLNNETYYNEVWPGISVYPSFIEPKTQEFWANNVKFLVSLGVRGIWNDMNEPASFKGPLPDNVEFKMNNKVYYHDEIHNIYAHYMNKATYEGLKKYDQRRPYIITRAAFAGTQKYATTWTGDQHSIYPHLQMMIPILLNLGLSGFPFAGTDIGGFCSDTTKELLIRFVEAGIFTPMFRNHSAMNTTYQEPWAFDEETLNIYRKMMKTRYQFIPYMYDLCFEACNTGLPIIRPLVMEFPQDKNTYEINDEYMLGCNVLVSPVLEQGKRYKLVYLPEGKWYSYFDNKEYEGGYHAIKCDLDEVLIFIKEGSIIPQYLDNDHIDPHTDTLILRIYPGQGNYVHYQDNGEDFKYEEGEYNMYEIIHDDNFLRINLPYHFYKAYKKIILKYETKEVTITDFNQQLEIK